MMLLCRIPLTLEPGLHVGYSTQIEPTFGCPCKKGVASCFDTATTHVNYHSCSFYVLIQSGVLELLGLYINLFIMWLHFDVDLQGFPI